MQLLIDKSFFVGDINIPNAEKEPVKSRVDQFISKYEPECLNKLLGYSLYKALGSESSQRMTDLKDGVEYYRYGILTKWQGLVHDNQSLIAKYIFYHYVYHTNVSFNGNSTTVNKGDGAINVSPGDKMVTTWNNFSDEVRDLIDFLYENRLDYPEINGAQANAALSFSRKINIFNI